MGPLRQVCSQPLYQVLGGAARQAIRTYNTCAGYRYIRDAFLHRADELAHSLLEQGISGMKIWPFGPYAEASDGLYISGPDLQKALDPFRKIRAAVGNRLDIMVEFHSLWRLPAARADAWQLPVAPHDCK